MNTDFLCYLVNKDAEGKISGVVARQPIANLPEGEALVRVAYSSLNYKDGLAATGHPGVVRRFPHVPGIDAVGMVEASAAPDLRPGQAVLATSYELGAGRWGGWAEYVRAPAEWVLPLPAGLSPWESMILGTAGLTAAMSAETLALHDVRPESGEVVVTGASGGVGCLSVMLLAHLGYQVAAVTGKEAWRSRLMEFGASKVLTRDEVNDTSGKPLLAARWAGAVDTVGGNTLGTLLRQCASGACVAACGLVGGVEVPLTIYPLLLRGVTLAGIDSAFCPRERRLALWNKLATEWKLPNLDSVAITAGLEQMSGHVTRILTGQTAGRVVVELGQSAAS